VKNELLLLIFYIVFFLLIGWVRSPVAFGFADLAFELGFSSASAEVIARSALAFFSVFHVLVGLLFIDRCLWLVGWTKKMSKDRPVLWSAIVSRTRK